MGGPFQMQGTEKNAAQSMPSSLSNMIFRTWGTTSITSGGENRRLLSIAHADVILELVCGQQGLSNSGGLQGRPFANFLSSLNETLRAFVFQEVVEVQLFLLVMLVTMELPCIQNHHFMVLYQERRVRRWLLNLGEELWHPGTVKWAEEDSPQKGRRRRPD